MGVEGNSALFASERAPSAGVPESAVGKGEQDLKKEDLIRILVEPNNALVKQYKALLEMDNVAFEMTDDALCAVAEKAIARQIGARGLRAVMEETMLRIMFEIPSDLTIQKVRITAACVNGGNPEIIRDAKNPRPKPGTK